MSDAADLFLDRVRETIAAHGMLQPGDRVLVAVSGGPDSVALLHVLHALGYHVVIAHLDHCTRDGESARDAAFVCGLAEALAVPIVVESHAVEAEAEARPESFEQTARMMRYQFFERIAAMEQCAAVATGHNADDVAETVLWRMLRGTSVDGVAGIPPVRMAGGVRVVRPFIACPRAAIFDYMRAESIVFRQDSSNEDRRFLRNRIRHDLIPQLEREYNPKLKEALVRLATLARDDTLVVANALEAFLANCMRENGDIDRARFARGEAALQRRAIQAFALRHNVEPTFERTEAARNFILEGRTGAHLDMGGAALTNLAETTRFLLEPAALEPENMAVPGETTAFGRRFTARILDQPPDRPWAGYCTPSRQVFDADILGKAVRIRARQPGDRFTPLGMTGTRKLQDYFVDNGMPHDLRDAVPIVVAHGRIAWIVGGAIDTAFAVRESTKRIVEMTVTNATE